MKRVALTAALVLAGLVAFEPHVRAAIVDRLAWGSTWILTVDAAPDGVTTAPAGSIAVLNTGGGAWLNTNGGTSWVDFVTGYPDIAWDPANFASEGLDVPSVDLLRGDMNTTGWDSAINYNGAAVALALDSATVTNRGVQVVVSATHATKTGGWLRQTIAADAFVYYMRIGVGGTGRAPTAAATPDFFVNAIYVNGTDLSAAANIGGVVQWVGLLAEGDGAGAVGYGVFFSNVPALDAAWNGGYGAGSWTQTSEVSAFDAWIKRSGTGANRRIDMYGSYGGAPPRWWYGRVLGGSGAGLIGLQIYNNTASNVARAWLLAFARVAEVPGL